MEKSSERSFWTGVPVRRMRLGMPRLRRALQGQTARLA